MSPPLFPVRLTELPCDLHLHDINEGAFEIPGVDVRTALVCHPGPDRRLPTRRRRRERWRISPITNRRSRRTASPYDPEWCSGLELAAGVDVLIHDAQYTDAEYETRVGWGHSTLGHALAFAELARVGRFVPFHHDPAHDDDMLDDFFRDAPSQQPRHVRRRSRPRGRRLRHQVPCSWCLTDSRSHEGCSAPPRSVMDPRPSS